MIWNLKTLMLRTNTMKNNQRETPERNSVVNINLPSMNGEKNEERTNSNPNINNQMNDMSEPEILTHFFEYLKVTGEKLDTLFLSVSR